MSFFWREIAQNDTAARSFDIVFGSFRRPSGRKSCLNARSVTVSLP
jgi:hypothetical protein